MDETALINRARELKELGKSIRQIAAELEVSKSKVFRWLNGQSSNNGIEMPIALFAQANTTNENHKNKTQMENHNDNYRLEKEIALKKLQLEHELELRKLAQQEKELELRKREMELKHQEKDMVKRQQQIEENKLLFAVKKWVKEEKKLLDNFDYEEILVTLALFRKRLFTLEKLIQQAEEHISVYGYERDDQLFLDELMKLYSFLDEVNSEFDEDEDDSAELPEISYEWPENYLDILENLEDSAFLP
ncbi:MAG: hypothetical protein EBX50_14185 [Chitinophagia bacterium]|nr:hypothetical protein [Chitinophagia bacterium]